MPQRQPTFARSRLDELHTLRININNRVFGTASDVAWWAFGTSGRSARVWLITKFDSTACETRRVQQGSDFQPEQKRTGIYLRELVLVKLNSRGHGGKLGTGSILRLASIVPKQLEADGESGKYSMLSNSLARGIQVVCTRAFYDLRNLRTQAPHHIRRKTTVQQL